MPDIGERADLVYRLIKLMMHRQLGRLAHDQMRFDGQITEQLQRPHTILHAGRATDTNDQPIHWFARLTHSR